MADESDPDVKPLGYAEPTTPRVQTQQRSLRLDLDPRRNTGPLFGCLTALAVFGVAFGIAAVCSWAMNLLW